MRPFWGFMGDGPDGSGDWQGNIFPVQITERTQEAPPRYAWIEQDFDPAYGTFQNAESPREGNASNGELARELNDGVHDPPFFTWLRLRGESAEGSVWEFERLQPPAETTSGIWRYQTDTTMADPNSGNLRLNNAALSSATQLAIHRLTENGTDVSAILRALRAGDGLRVQDQANNANWVRYNVTGTPVDNTEWFQIALELHAPDSFGGTAPGNNDLLLVTFALAGGGGAGGGEPGLITVSLEGVTTVYNVSTLQFRGGDGFVLTQPVAGTAKVGMEDASTGNPGVVNTSAQSFAGTKTFFDGVVKVGSSTRDATHQIFIGAGGNAGSYGITFNEPGIANSTAHCYLSPSTDGSGRARLTLAGTSAAAGDPSYALVGKDNLTYTGAHGTDSIGTVVKGGLIITLGTGGGGGGGGAPVDAAYITAATHATLTAERVLTNTATLTWDFATAGQAKGNVVGVAPVDAAYITSAAHGTLTAERVLTDTATVTWDFSTAGQAKANAVGGGGADEKAKVSSADTTTSYLSAKLQAGANVTLSVSNAGGDERLIIAAATGGGGTGTVTSVGAGTGLTAAPSPITTSGTISLVTPVTVANGGTGATTAATALANLGGVPTTRTLATTAPLAGGGDLSANRTLSVSNFTAGAAGTVPASGGGTANFLRADGIWTAPPGGGGGLDEKAKVTSNDTAGDYLKLKLAAGTGVTLEEINDGGYETLRINASGAGGGAPVDAPYITSASHATLTAERVATQSNTVAWDFATAGQAKANARTQLSLTSDAAGLKLQGDAAAPTINSKFYGADASGVRGWYAVSASTIGCSLTASSDQVLASATYQSLSFDQESFDNGPCHDPAAALNARITVPTGQGGQWLFGASITFASGQPGRRFARWQINGITNATFANIVPPSNIAQVLSGTILLTMAAGSFITVQAYQDSGANLAVFGASPGVLGRSFWGIKVG
jgi:hypothetical protein